MISSQCAGKGCSGRGAKHLKLRFIGLVGWFCESCANGLLKDNLAEEAK